MKKNLKSYKNPIFAWQDDSERWEDDLEEILDDFGYQYCDGSTCSYAEQCDSLIGVEAVQFCHKHTGKTITAYIAERVEIPLKDLVSGIVWNLQELISENSYEEVGEVCLRYCEDVENMLKDNKNADELEILITDWLISKVSKPTFYKTECEQEIDVLKYLEGKI